MEVVNNLLDILAADVSKDSSNRGCFSEPWAARYNHEIWGTGPSGMYDCAGAFSLSKPAR
jgi:hypothetical protein